MQKIKIEKIKNIIIEENLSAIAVFRPEELLMGIGYHPHIGLSVGVFFKSHEPILYVGACEPLSRIVDAIPLIKKFDFSMGRDGQAELFEKIKRDIKTFGGEKPLGLVKNSTQTSITGTCAENIALSTDFMNSFDTISKGGFKDISVEFNSLFSIKTSEDIIHLKKVYQVAKVGIEAFYQNLSSGNSEIDVKASIERAITLEGNRKDVFMTYSTAQVQSGENTTLSGTYNMSTQNVLKDGDLVLLELAVCVNGYWCDITRTGCVGAPSELNLRLYNIVKNAQMNAINAIKEGAAFSYVYNQAMKVIKDNGYEKNFPHALGHGVGYRYHDYCPQLIPTNNDKIKEGMVLTVEPGIYGEFGGIRIEDNVLCLKNGVEVLSKDLPRGLWGDEKFE